MFEKDNRELHAVGHVVSLGSGSAMKIKSNLNSGGVQVGLKSCLDYVYIFVKQYNMN